MGKRTASQADISTPSEPWKKQNPTISPQQALRDKEPWRENRTGRFENPEADWTENELLPGDLIWAPWHVTALRKGHQTEQQKDRNCWNNNFPKSKCAVICSKRRMFCVHYAHPGAALEAFPMFTHGKKGLNAVPEGQQMFRIPVRDDEMSNWEEPSTGHRAVIAEVWRSQSDCTMGNHTIIDYTKPRPIELSEHIELVGRLKPEGCRYVLAMHEAFRKAGLGKAEECRKVRDGEGSEQLPKSEG